MFNEFGLTPDTPEQIEEVRRGQVSFSSFIDGTWQAQHGPYPQTRYDVPPDISWDSFKPELVERKAHFDKLREKQWCLWWWEIARAYGLPVNQVFWSNQGNTPSCFPMHTKVYTEQGSRTIQDLLDNQPEFITLSWSKRLNRVAAKRAAVYRTGEKPCVRITTDKGVFDLTEDHPVMLKTGEFVKAGQLKPGLSLHPCSTHKKDHDRNDNYISVDLGKKGKYENFHRLIAKDVLDWDVKDMVVHHIDENPLNNVESNLTLLTRSEHRSLRCKEVHPNRLAALQSDSYRAKASERTVERNKDPEFKAKMTKGVHDFYDNRSEEEREAHIRKVLKGQEAYQNSLTDEDRELRKERISNYMKLPEARQRCREAAYARTSEQNQRSGLAAGRAKTLKSGYRLINSGADISDFDSLCCALNQKTPKQRQKLEARLERYFGSFEGYQDALAEGNHRVISVVSIGVMPVASVEVFDEEPDDKRPWSEHNFMLCPEGCDDHFVNGILVANCAGFSAAKAYERKVIYQMLTAPIRWDAINPMPMWAITKNYSTSGGQSMSGVKIGASKWGNYAVTDPGIGEFPGRVDKNAYESAAQYAQRRQLCSCNIPATVEALQLCLDACEVVAIGNYTACKTARLDSNGILIGVIGGSWAHAHTYDAIRYVKGVPYFHWSNSWGEMYKGDKENCPLIGCWHTVDTVRSMLKGANCFTTVYAEAFSTMDAGATSFAPRFVGYPDYITHKHST